MRKWHGKELYTGGDMYRITGTDPKTEALRVYERDKWKLLMPSAVTEYGTRLYDDEALLRFVFIRIFISVGYSLDKIKKIFEDPEFDIRRIADEQLYEIEKKKAELEQKADIVKTIKRLGIEFFAGAALSGSTLEKYIETHPVMVEEPIKTDEEIALENERDELFQEFLDLKSRDYHHKV